MPSGSLWSRTTPPASAPATAAWAARIKAALPPLEAGTSYRYGDGWMGIGWQASDDGVKIVAVAPEGPAGKAGIQAGDVVVAINQQPINGFGDVFRLYRQVKADQNLSTVEVKLERQGQLVTKTYRIR